MFYGSPPIVTNGLVAYYDPANSLSARSGSSIVTEIGGINNMPLTMSALSALGTTSASFSSQYGGVLQFNGTSSYALCSNTSSQFFTNMADANPKSLFAWINLNSPLITNDGTANLRIINIANSSAGFYSVLSVTGFLSSASDAFYFGGTPNFNTNRGFTGPDTGSSAGIGKITGFPCNKWCYIGIIYDAVITFQCYYNGIPYAHNSQVGSSDFTNSGLQGLVIGAKADATVPQAFFNGQMGPIQIYNRSLTQAEVVQNFNAHKSRFNLTENGS